MRASAIFQLCRASIGPSIAIACVFGCASATAAPLPKNSPLYNPGGSPIVNGNPEVSVEYRGKITQVWEYPAINGGLEHVSRTATMEWTEGVSGPVDEIEYTGIYGAQSIHWKVAKLSGSVSENSTGPGGEPRTCSGSFSPTSTDGGEQGVFVPLETPGHPAGGGDPATNPDYSVRPPFGIPSQLLKSSGAAGSLCQTSSWNSNGNSGWGGAAAFGSPVVQSEWGDVSFPTVYFPVGGSHTQPLDFHYACEPPSCGPESDGTNHYGKVKLDLESSITFSSPGLGSGDSPKTKKGKPGSPGGSGSGPSGCASKGTCPDKKAAREDFKQQLRPAALECGLTALGTGLLVAGAVAPETGAGLALAAAGPTGAMMLPLSGAACALLIKRMTEDAEIAKDPPTGSIRKLARPSFPSGAPAKLPSCATFAAEVQAYCKRLGTAVLRYLNALRRGDAIDAALVTTVDRVSGAARARNRSALALQKAHASQLRSQLRASDRAEGATGAALAGLIRAQHVIVSLTAAQDQQGVARLLAGLARHRFSRSTLERLTGASFAASPLDGLEVLAGG